MQVVVQDDPRMTKAQERCVRAVLKGYAELGAGIEIGEDWKKGYEEVDVAIVCPYSRRRPIKGSPAWNTAFAMGETRGKVVFVWRDGCRSYWHDRRGAISPLRPLSPPRRSKRNWHRFVASSDGVTKYKVRFQNGIWYCECKGFAYRGACRHVDLVKGEVK